MLNEDFTEVEWVRQTDQVLVIKDRQRGSPHKEPEQCLGRIEPAVQERASTPLGLHRRRRHCRKGLCRPAHGREMGGSATKQEFSEPSDRHWCCWRLGRPGTTAEALWSSSTRARCGTSPGLLGSWPNRRPGRRRAAHFAERSSPPCVLCTNPGAQLPHCPEAAGDDDAGLGEVGE